jgi:hypothetical protein
VDQSNTALVASVSKCRRQRAIEQISKRRLTFAPVDIGKCSAVDHGRRCGAIKKVFERGAISQLGYELLGLAEFFNRSPRLGRYMQLTRG